MKATFNCRLNGRISKCRSRPQITVASTWSLPRSRSTGSLTPELYQETLALYQGKLDGYTEHACREITLAEAPAWLLDYSWNGPEDEGNQGRIGRMAYSSGVEIRC